MRENLFEPDDTSPVEGAAAALAENANTLKAKLHGGSRPWGTDEPGQVFEKDYAAAAAAIGKVLAAAAAELAELTRPPREPGTRV